MTIEEMFMLQIGIDNKSSGTMYDIRISIAFNFLLILLHTILQN